VPIRERASLLDKEDKEVGIRRERGEDRQTASAGASGIVAKESRIDLHSSIPPHRNAYTFDYLAPPLSLGAQKASSWK
jgi:hypothetical protein